MAPTLPVPQTVEPRAVPEPALEPSSHICLRGGGTAASVAEPVLLPLGVLLNDPPISQAHLDRESFPLLRKLLWDLTWG